MIYYDGIDCFEGTNVNKTSKSKECDICLYWYFLINFNQMFVMDAMLSMNLSNIAILNIKSVGYRYIISTISKSEAINLMQNIDLTEKRGTF